MDGGLLSIGEFSQAARLTVKTLRYYHEVGILPPVRLDATTCYRCYDDSSYKRAAAIASLKELGFSLEEIRIVLDECSSDEDLAAFIERKLREVRSRVARLRAPGTVLRGNPSDYVTELMPSFNRI